MLPPPVLIEPDDRRLLRKSVADFTARHGAAAAVRTRRKSELGYDPAVWREMAGLGWLQLAIPEARGGLGLGFADLAALHEEIGKSALPEPLASVGVLAAGALAASDTRFAVARLERLMAGELLATLAWQGRTGVITAEAVTATAERDGSGYRLRGEARFVPAAAGAQGLIVAARVDSGLALFWVDPKADGVALALQSAADYSRVADVALRGVAVNADAMLVGPAAGMAVLDRLLDRGRVAVAAESVGVMHAILATTLDYLRTRQQFGKPIGGFQALQHRAVDLYVQIELSRSAVLKAAAAIDEGSADVPLLAAGVKARCSNAAVQVAGQSVHLHGAIGLTEEIDLSILIRRAHFLSAWLGNGESGLKRFGALRGIEGRAA